MPAMQFCIIDNRAGSAAVKFTVPAVRAVLCGVWSEPDRDILTPDMDALRAQLPAQDRRALDRAGNFWFDKEARWNGHRASSVPYLTLRGAVTLYAIPCATDPAWSTLALINARIDRGLSYGPDMASSRAVCLNDAAEMLSRIVRAGDHRHYHHANAADDLFHAELVRQFGREACNARYDARRTDWDNRTKAAGSLKLIADARRRIAAGSTTPRAIKA